jgi:hypothetical protein
MNTIVCNLILSVIFRLQEKSGKNNDELIISIYNTVSIVVKIGHDFLITNTFIHMSILFAMEVICNFVTLKLYHVIPMPFYLYFPSVSILVPICVQIMLPVMTRIFMEGSKLVRKWEQNIHKGSSSRSEMKYLKRKLKSVRVIQMTGGILRFNLYEMNNSTKASFLYVTIEYTINALLSIPSK